MVKEPYPSRQADRDAWILRHRGPRRSLDPFRPYAVITEPERSVDGPIASVTTVFLTNRECPWKCLFCDLWRNTLETSVPPGAIPAQIDRALEESASARRYQSPVEGPSPRYLKLYNSGSFFDPRAIPEEDLAAIAKRARPFDRVIVESHPSLVDDRVVRFRDLLRKEGPIALEVAIGLETANPVVLEKLNKRMTLELFAAAAGFLGRHDIDLRCFVLVQPPFMLPSESLPWARRSIDVAFDEGASVVSLIPTRPGNGATDALAERGLYTKPTLTTLEQAVDYGVRSGQGRVFADLWDLETFATCRECFPARAERLRRLNLTQKLAGPIACPSCGYHG